jgi:hypothetical protein
MAMFDRAGKNSQQSNYVPVQVTAAPGSTLMVSGEQVRTWDESGRDVHNEQGSRFNARIHTAWPAPFAAQLMFEEISLASKFMMMSSVFSHKKLSP